MSTVVSEKAWRDEFRTTLDDGRTIRTSRIPSRAPKTGAAILRRAAGIIQSRGLAKGTMRDENGCRCMYAALLEAAGLGYDLDVPISTGHIDARQVDFLSAFDRFDNLRAALAMLGQPDAWGSTSAIAPLARFSDRSSAWTVASILRGAAAGTAPEWTTKTLDGDEIAELAR